MWSLSLHTGHVQARDDDDDLPSSLTSAACYATMPTETPKQQFLTTLGPDPLTDLHHTKLRAHARKNTRLEQREQACSQEKMFYYHYNLCKPFLRI